MLGYMLGWGCHLVWNAPLLSLPFTVVAWLALSLVRTCSEWSNSMEKGKGGKRSRKLTLKCNHAANEQDKQHRSICYALPPLRFLHITDFFLFPTEFRLVVSQLKYFQIYSAVCLFHAVIVSGCYKLLHCWFAKLMELCKTLFLYFQWTDMFTILRHNFRALSDKMCIIAWTRMLECWAPADKKAWQDPYNMVHKHIIIQTSTWQIREMERHFFLVYF